MIKPAQPQSTNYSCQVFHSETNWFTNREGVDNTDKKCINIVMHKILLFLFFSLLLLFLHADSVLAAEFSSKNFYDWGNWYRNVSVLSESTISEPEIKNVQGMLPDNPFYFFKPLAENVFLTFTFDLKAKEVKRLEIAEERLAETKALLEKKRYDLASKNFGRYKSSLNELTANVDKSKAEKLELYSAKHSLVLEKLEETVPEELKDDLKIALEAAQKSMDKSADNLGKPPVTAELRNRLESLRVLGILTPEEVSSVLSLSSREKVRKKLEDLVNQNRLPPTDAKKVDEAQLRYFPSEYVKISEQKKLQEFATLENQKPDEATQKRISEFAAKYKPGDQIPPDIKKWWISAQRYQELQTTLRPELVPPPKKQQENAKTQKPQGQTNASSSTTPTPQSSGQPSITRSPLPSTTSQFGSQCNFSSHAIGTIFADGKCYYLRCEEGWYNNDLDVNNGCESRTDAGVTPPPGSVAAGVCGSGQVKNDQGVCVSENQTCTDTNSAVPFYTTGSCTDQTGPYTNYCEGSVSKDYLCEGTWDPQTLSSKNHHCVVHSFDCGIASTAEQYVCSAGACVK